MRGEVDPQVGSALKLLARWAWEMGDATAARRHFERALAIEQSLSGERGMETVLLHQALEAICAQLGDTCVPATIRAAAIPAAEPTAAATHTARSLDLRHGGCPSGDSRIRSAQLRLW